MRHFLSIPLFNFILMALMSLGLTLQCSLARATNAQDFWFYVTNDKAEDISVLLSQGFDPNVQNKNQQPALVQAVRDNSFKVFDLLLASPKINVNQLNSFGESALMYVALVGDLPRVQKLIDKGAKVNQDGWSPLHYACIKGRANIVRLLLEKGAKPNEISPTGDTALILAVQSDSIETVQLLLNAGADPLASNLKAQDAIDMAKLKGKEDLAISLQKFVERRQSPQ
jgi:ankyrin repeat protein